MFLCMLVSMFFMKNLKNAVSVMSYFRYFVKQMNYLESKINEINRCKFSVN